MGSAHIITLYRKLRSTNAALGGCEEYQGRRPDSYRARAANCIHIDELALAKGQKSIGGNFKTCWHVSLPEITVGSCENRDKSAGRERMALLPASTWRKRTWSRILKSFR